MIMSNSNHWNHPTSASKYTVAQLLANPNLKETFKTENNLFWNNTKPKSVHQENLDWLEEERYSRLFKELDKNIIKVDKPEHILSNKFKYT